MNIPYTYEIVHKGSSTGITCYYCGRTSWNQNDVERHYCGHCHVWHDDRLMWFTKDEWFDVARRLKPDITRAMFDKMWDDYQRDKRAREHQRSLH